MLLQNKALGLWNPFMQKSGFPKMRHYVGFSQIGSQLSDSYKVKIPLWSISFGIT